MTWYDWRCAAIPAFSMGTEEGQGTMGEGLERRMRWRWEARRVCLQGVDLQTYNIEYIEYIDYEGDARLYVQRHDCPLYFVHYPSTTSLGSRPPRCMVRYSVATRQKDRGGMIVIATLEYRRTRWWDTKYGSAFTWLWVG